MVSLLKDNQEDLTKSQLLWYAIVSLVFIGIRILYSLVAVVSQEQALSPASGKLAVRVMLSLLPELICVVILVLSGISTRKILQSPK